MSNLLASLYEYPFRGLFLGSLIRAAGLTLLLTAASMPLAVAFGLVLALFRMSPRRWLSWPAAVYIEVVRGTPLLVQVFLVYYSLPRVGHAFHTDLLTWPPLIVAVLCLSGNYAAYEAEIHRAGILAVDRGQWEAAFSLGMTPGQALRIVVLPQAFRIVTPPIINDLIAMLKDTCLVSVIAVPELLAKAQAIGRERDMVPELLVAAAVLYLAMSLPCYYLGKAIERRLKVKGGAEVPIDRVHGH